MESQDDVGQNTTFYNKGVDTPIYSEGLLMRPTFRSRKEYVKNTQEMLLFTLKDHALVYEEYIWNPYALWIHSQLVD